MQKWCYHWNNTYANALGKLCSQDKKFYIYRHENMVGNPEVELSKILDFLDQNFESNCLKMEKQQWNQNSSFDQNSWNETNVTVGIDTSTLDRWRSELSSFEVRKIELYCQSVMLIFNYSEYQKIRFHDTKIASKIVKNFLRFFNYKYS